MHVEAPVRSPFLEFVGVQFARTADGGYEVSLPVRAEHLNSAGMVHGGVYATLGDAALAAAVHASIGPQQMVITVEMSCRYLEAGRGGVLLARGRVLRAGRRIVVAEADIFCEGRLQYRGSGTFTVVPRHPGAESEAG